MTWSFVQSNLYEADTFGTRASVRLKQGVRRTKFFLKGSLTSVSIKRPWKGQIAFSWTVDNSEIPYFRKQRQVYEVQITKLLFWFAFVLSVLGLGALFVLYTYCFVWRIMNESWMKTFVTVWSVSILTESCEGPQDKNRSSEKKKTNKKILHFCDSSVLNDRSSKT